MGLPTDAYDIKTPASEKQRVARVQKLIDLISAKTPRSVRMDLYLRVDKRKRPPVNHNCGTAGCIAGWAASLAMGSPERLIKHNPSNFDVEPNGHVQHANRDAVEASARRFLGLGHEEASALFYAYGRPCNIDLEGIKKAEVIKALKILRDYNVVCWEGVWDKDKLAKYKTQRRKAA